MADPLAINRQVMQRVRAGLAPLSSIISPGFIQIADRSIVITGSRRLGQPRIGSRGLTNEEEYELQWVPNTLRNDWDDSWLAALSHALQWGTPFVVTKEQFEAVVPHLAYTGLDMSLLPPRYTLDFIMDQLEVDTVKLVGRPNRMRVTSNLGMREIKDKPSLLDRSYQHGSPPMPQWEVRQFMLLLRLMRPTLCDEEIKLMPPLEIIDLYYNLQAGGHTSCEEPKPFLNPVVTRGFQSFTLGYQYEYNLQKRIWDLRPELRQLTDAKGKVYRVLLSPDQLIPQPCEEKFYENMGFKVFTGVLSLVAGPIGLAAMAASTAAAVATTVRSAKGLAKLGKLQSEIVGGIQLAGVLPAPVPDAGILQVLRTKEDMWRQAVNVVVPNQRSIFSRWRLIPGPERVFGITPSRVAMSNPVMDWRLYDDFYYSPTVRQLAQVRVAEEPLTQGWLSALMGLFR